MSRADDYLKMLADLYTSRPQAAASLRQQQLDDALRAAQLQQLGPGAFGPQPMLKLKEPHEVELDTARILIVALLRRLGGHVTFNPEELMFEPGLFSVKKHHNDDSRAITFQLQMSGSDKVVEEPE